MIAKNRVYRQPAKHDGSRLRKLVPPQKRISWWTQHAAPESRNGFIAAAKERDAKRLIEQDLLDARQLVTSANATIAFWKL